MSLTDELILTALKRGRLTIRGEFLWGSNFTFFGKVEYEGQTLKTVYKPTRGERPLWDFPVATLARREVAAYVVSEALGWRLVPPTVYRQKGPAGAGSLQLFIDHDPEYHYFSFNDTDRQRLRPVVLFDLLVNNADRKGGHVLVDPELHIWLIDHGICFHEEDKLRTVIWDFVGESIPEDLSNDLDRFRLKLERSVMKPVKPPDNPPVEPPDGLAAELRKYLNPAEIEALASRAGALLDQRIFPPPQIHQRSIPWPPV